VIASRRGVLVLVAIAVMLVAALARALMRPRPEPVDRSIAPGLDADRVTVLAWEYSSLPAVTVRRSENGAWAWESSGIRAAADMSSVRDVLAALRAGRWHRRAEVHAAGELRARLTVETGVASRTFGIGLPLEGTEQQWIVAGDDALLVDRWIARALEPDPLALRVRRPIESAAAQPDLSIWRGTVARRLEGTPRRLTMPRDATAPLVVLPKAELLVRLDRALEALEIVRLSRPARDEDVTLRVRSKVSVGVAPVCPDEPALAWMASDAGNGCIERAVFDELTAAALAFEQPLLDLVEPRPVPFDVDAVTLIDGKVLELSRGPQIDSRRADAEGVARLLAALGAQAQVSPDIEGPVMGQIRLAVRGGGAIELELLGEGRLRRRGEPVVLRLAPAAYAALNHRAVDLADRSVWSEEPTTITELAIDGVSYRRGTVVGEWSRTPPGPVDGARVEAVIAALARVERSPDVASLGKRHDVAIVVTPPAGASVRHELAVGAPRQGGCPAYAGEATVILSPPVCASIAALAR